jgi:hypothetical protein
MDPMRSPETGAHTRAPRPPPIELDAEGQALHERLRTFRTQAVRKNYKVSTRPPATLPLSPRVLKCIFLFWLSTHNSPRPASSWPFLESAEMAIVEFVSQHEEVSMRAPRFCVAYQAPHAVARDGTHAVAGDGSHAVAADRHTHTCAAASARRARRRGPGPPQTAPHVPHAGGEKLQSSTRPPATFPFSPRELICNFSLPALNAQLTLSGVLMTIFRVCGNGDSGVC